MLDVSDTHACDYYRKRHRPQSNGFPPEHRQNPLYALSGLGSFASGAVPGFREGMTFGNNTSLQSHFKIGLED